MLALKDTTELMEYSYDVCEISGCETEATDFYESDDISAYLCHGHYRDFLNKQNVW